MQPLDVRPLHPLFGAEVRGVDFGKTPTPDLVEAIKNLWLEHKVLIFPNQAITDEQQVAFSRCLHDLEEFPMKSVRNGMIFRVANTDDDGKKLSVDDDRVRYLKVTQIWHNDSSYRQDPSIGAILR